MIGKEFDKNIIGNYFNSSESEELEKYIIDIFCDETKVKELRSHLLHQFDDLETNDDQDKQRLDAILHKIHFDINSSKKEIKNSPTKSIVSWFMRIAAILILPIIVFFGIYIYNENSVKKEAWVEIVAPSWSRVQFNLPDGTNGWLNSGSRLKYQGNFASNRNVTLKGEAFFDVAHNSKSKFSVSTANIKTTVFGTRFNISSYETDKNVEVVLEEGKLLFEDNSESNSYTMKPGDLVRYEKASKNFSTEVVEVQKYVSWTQGKLVFRNDPIEQVALRLGRWYNVDVEIKGKITDDIRWRATFVDESLEEVMSWMKRSLNVNYTIEDRHINSNGSLEKRKVIISI